MLRAVTCRYRGGKRSTSIAYFSFVSLEFLEMSTESRLNVRPASSILAFFLAPSDGGVLILLGAGGQGTEGEGRHLLNTDDSDVVNSSLLTGSF